MPYEILSWATIAEKYRGTVFLGNGASISVSPTFSYRSLLEHAVEEQLLAADVQQIFDFFGTEDFELILRIVWQAANVNRSLGIADERTRAAYLAVRDALIRAVQNIHPEYDDVAAHLPAICQFLKNFDTVISLNYDLLLYWAMMHGFNAPDRHEFKDCFLAGEFSEDWQKLREPIRGAESTTLVFYPHGSLILCRDKLEQEGKIHGRDSRLLEAILRRWQSEEVVPLFVSEGTWQQKVSSIRNSFYLSTVYREVLTAPCETLVIYGWGLGEQDLHLLHRMSKANVKRVAVSIYREDQGYCTRASQIIKDALGGDVEVEFFDSESDGCWMHTG